MTVNRTFILRAYKAGAFPVALYEEGKRMRIKRWDAWIGSVRGRPDLFRMWEAQEKRVTAERDAWLKKWVKGKVDL